MKMLTGAQLIKGERRRQITKEKWTAKHDDAHENYSLSQAALCYERCAEFQENCGKFPRELTRAFEVQPRNWPWAAYWFKLGRTVIRTLVKAGALYQAEIDRIERASRRGCDMSLCAGCLNGAKSGVLRIAKKIDQLSK
jgi:hypothetical protein